MPLFNNKNKEMKIKAYLLAVAVLLLGSNLFGQYLNLKSPNEQIEIRFYTEPGK